MVVRKMCVLALASAGLLLGSCRAPAPAPTPVASNVANERYRLGTYNAEFASSLFNVDKALRAACRRAKLIELSRVNRGNTCSYLYKDVDGNKLSMDLSEKDGLVKIAMRVGRRGDKASSQTLLAAIAEELALL
jgi:hypothetical protein